jgi:hypothetical protein
MSRRFPLLIAAALALPLWAQQSVVLNGDFEELDQNGKARHWEASRIETLPDGGHALSVPFTWGFCQTVQVEPNTRYLASMDVKRKRGPSAARLVISVRDEDGNKLNGADVRYAFVGDDWETARGVVATPPGAHQAILYVLTLDKDRQSEFLCDNVRMVPLGSAGELTGRVWQTPDPVYEPLIGDEPPGLVREGPMVWAHMLYIDQLRDVAARMGRRYGEDEIYAHLAQHNMHPIRLPASPMYKKHGVTSAIYPRYKPKDAASMLEPRSIDFYIDNVRNTLAEHGDQIWAVFAQDEAEEHAIREITAMAEEPGDNADTVEHFDRDIRERFGFGRFGLPTGEGDDEPFRWIAFRRWVNDRFRERHTRLAALVHENHPGIRLISTDPMGHLSPFEFSLQRDFFDIFTQQFLPHSNPTRCPLGLYVKLIADLTGKEVWPCVHVEHYAYSTTPEEVRELYSQVWRNGGSGFHLYIPDTANARKKKGDTRLTQFGSPPRYRAILEIMERASRQNKLRFPDDEGCRIFYSNYAHMAFANPSSVQDPVEACYTLVGPHAGSWFTITDEHRFADPGAADRAKVVYLPYARIFDGASRKRLEAFVRNGGTLIVADPLAFEYDIDGKPTRDQREKLTGTTWTGERAGGTLLTVTPERLPGGKSSPMRLPLLSTAYRVRTAPGTQVIGTYDDGSACITSRPLGEGRVIYFAASPFTAATLATPDWQTFFKRLQKALGLATDLDIWRFKFPPFETVALPPTDGQCLTENHVLWREDTQHPAHNLETGGTYTLQPPPEDAENDAENANVAFENGDLTDRRQWPQLEKVAPKSYQRYDEPISRWVDTWRAPGEVTVTFDFNKPYPIGRAHLWVSGTVPAVTLQASDDGADWRTVGSADGVRAGNDVLDMVVPADGTAARYVRLVFPKRDNEPMTLAEVEIWTAGQ